MDLKLPNEFAKLVKWLFLIAFSGRRMFTISNTHGDDAENENDALRVKINFQT